MAAQDPSGFSLTYGDLLAVAAQMVGEETIDADTGAIVPPTSDAERQRAERVVRRAIQRVQRESRMWSWVRQPVSLTLDADGDGPKNIDGDAARYLMPWYFTGRAQGPWSFTGSSDPAGVVEVVGELVGACTQAIDPDRTGDPEICFFRMRDRNNQRADMWEAVFWPKPDTARTVRLVISADLSKPWSDDDRFPVPNSVADLMERATQLEAAREAAPDQIGVRADDYSIALQDELAIDRDRRPPAEGRLRRTLRTGHSVEPRDQTRDISSVTVNGTSVT